MRDGGPRIQHEANPRGLSCSVRSCWAACGLMGRPPNKRRQPNELWEVATPTPARATCTVVFRAFPRAGRADSLANKRAAVPPRAMGWSGQWLRQAAACSRRALVPARFARSRAVGPHFGLTPRKWQSGEIDRMGQISKCGDAMMRTALYEAANSMLSRTTRWSWLKAGSKAARQEAGEGCSCPPARRDHAPHLGGWYRVPVDSCRRHRRRCGLKPARISEQRSLPEGDPRASALAEDVPVGTKDEVSPFKPPIPLCCGRREDVA